MSEQWLDLNGEGWLPAVVRLYRDGVWEFEDGTRRTGFSVVLSGIVPTFAWRARAEEKLLGRSFGERYAVYRARTRLLIPYLL